MSRVEVKRVVLEGFMRHDRFELELPRRGVVAVVGPNGSGKSSLIEAVSFALWGSTLRGANPWRDGTACSVEVELYDGTRVVRRRRPRGGYVIDVDGQAHHKQSTAAAAIESRVGTHGMWQRTCVLSSSDSASRFSAATDKERKAIIEAMLGLEQFDRALDALKVLKQANASRLMAASNEVSQIRGQLEGLRSAVGDDVEVLEAKRGELAKGVTRYRQRLEQEQQEYEQALERVEEARRRVYQLQAQLGEHERRAGVFSGRSCPTCGQPIAESLRQHVERELSLLRERLEHAKAALTQHESVYSEAVRRYNEVSTLSTRLEHELRSVDAALERARALADRIAAAQERLSEAARRQARVETLQGILDASASILGPRGLRVKLLGDALSALSELSTRWATRLFERPVEVKLTPGRQKKGGGYSPTIGFEVRGVGNGSYASASGGERRRVDLAVLWALSELAGDHQGSTLWCDEIYDALDDAGIDAVAASIREVAQSRCIVVISHVPSLVDAVSPDRVVTLSAS